jgi:hypothetical protein
MDYCILNYWPWVYALIKKAIIHSDIFKPPSIINIEGGFFMLKKDKLIQEKYNGL